MVGGGSGVVDGGSGVVGWWGGGWWGGVVGWGGEIKAHKSKYSQDKKIISQGFEN